MLFWQIQKAQLYMRQIQIVKDNINSWVLDFGVYQK